MILSTFIHHYHPEPVTTLAEIKRLHNEVAPTDFIGAFAYATQSGLVSFELEMGSEFWTRTASRWLFGIDYGRTQPSALRKMLDKQNTDIRIVDGAWLVNQAGFLPRRDFHAKMSILINNAAASFGMVVGSGNFSSNGLRKSIEAGASIRAESVDEFDTSLKSALGQAEELWHAATPAADILEVYEERWRDSFSRKADVGAEDHPPLQEQKEIFWIEAGYVTRNRGPNSPGNQIDFPRRIASAFFGFEPTIDLAPNSVIGPVVLEPPVGGIVQNNLRLGNNMMEKISLPIPETHGFDIYDGKVLVFRREGGRFVMRALEAADFEAAFGDKLDDVRVMGSGRRYGFVD